MAERCVCVRERWHCLYWAIAAVVVVVVVMITICAGHPVPRYRLRDAVLVAFDVMILRVCVSLGRA